MNLTLMKKERLFARILLSAGFLAAVSSCIAATQDDNASIVLNNIATRASVRQFTAQPVDKATLETIVRAGMAAPSAVNRQPWAFVVVTERSVLDSLENVHPHANLKTATAAIIVCGDMKKALDGAAREYWVQDCSAVTQNILLAAHAMGLGAVWCGVYPSSDRVAAVSRVMGLPESVVPLNVITMGYPAEQPKPKDKWKPEKIHYQRW